MSPLIIILILLAVVAVVVLGKGSETPAANIMDPAAWEIGPIVRGENFSTNMPLHPWPHPEGWYIDIPYPNAEAGHVHYVTVPTTSLAGKTRVTIEARLEMADGVKLCPVKSPDAPSLLTLYFQRAGDNWTAQGEYEAYRWYAGFETRSDLKAGHYVLEASLDGPWGAVLTSTRGSNPEGFQAAINDAARIGFVLGGGDGLGHGVFATGAARLVVTSFSVE